MATSKHFSTSRPEQEEGKEKDRPQGVSASQETTPIDSHEVECSRHHSSETSEDPYPPPHPYKAPRAHEDLSADSVLSLRSSLDALREQLSPSALHKGEEEELKSCLAMEDLMVADDMGRLRLPSDLLRGKVVDDEEEEEEGAWAEEKTRLDCMGLSSERAEELLRIYGRNELRNLRLPKWRILAKILTKPMPILIWVTMIMEGVTQDWVDLAILLAVQVINASITFSEVIKASMAVAPANVCKDNNARVKRDGNFVTVKASRLVPGDVLLLVSGTLVPADCIVRDGQVDVDQATLTGETVPVTQFRGESVKMGARIVRGKVQATVEFTGKDTFFGRTATLAQRGCKEASSLDRVLNRTVFFLIDACVVCYTIAFVSLLSRGEELKETLAFTLELLVVSIPLAIHIVSTTILAMAARSLSKEGMTVRRLAAIPDLAGMEVLCTEKTGTLTLHKMAVREDSPVYVAGEDRASLLRLAAMAGRWREAPRDKLDDIVQAAADLEALEQVEQTAHIPFDPMVKRSEATVTLPTGESFRVTKGAPHIILKLLEGRHQDSIIQRVCTDVAALSERGVRCLAVARTRYSPHGPWEMVGLLTLVEVPRPETSRMLDKARDMGVEVKMVTGDHLFMAKETIQQLGGHGPGGIQDSTKLPIMELDGTLPRGIKTYLPFIQRSSGFAQALPEHKLLIVEALQRGGKVVGIMGEAVSDAPALRKANIGVAVEGAAASTRVASDLVLGRPGLSSIVQGIIVARKVFARLQAYITYRIAATIQLLAFFLFALLVLRPSLFHTSWPAFFSMPIFMLILIPVVNDAAMLVSAGQDHVSPSPLPVQWNLAHLFAKAATLALVPCLSSILMLSQVYLKVAISGILTFFSARCPDDFFWRAKRPAPLVVVSTLLACCFSTFLATLWPSFLPDKHAYKATGLIEYHHTLLVAYVWAYCLICWLIQDGFKVGSSRLFRHFRAFDRQEEEDDHHEDERV